MLFGTAEKSLYTGFFVSERLVMKRLNITILTVWMLAAAPAVLAQSSPDLDALIDRGREAGLRGEQVQAVTDRAREQGLSAEQVAQLIEPAVQLAEQDLPGEAVLGKVLEGMAKGVPFTRIHPVVGRLQEGTREVGMFVRGWARRQEVREMMGGREAGDPEASEAAMIESAARARVQGASQDLIQNFLSNLPAETSRRPITREEVVTALPVLSDAAAAGSGAEGFRRFVTEAIDAGMSPETMRQIPTALQAANRRTGRPVEAIARHAASAIASGAPASDVLTGLFEGGGPGLGPPEGSAGPPNETPPGQDLPPESGPPSDRPGQGEGGDGPPGNDSPGGDGPPDEVPRGGSGA